MNQLVKGRSSGIRSNTSSKGDQKAFYRFPANEKVSEAELIESCTERTGAICQARHVLVLNDTTEINLQSHAGRINHDSGVGVTGNNSDLGFFMHLGLAVDAEQVQAMGYSHIHLWHRQKDKGSKESRGYKQLPVEEKESYKWIQCAIKSKELLKNAACITIAGDRESDMYELFSDAARSNVQLIARSRINRKTEEGSYLYDLLQHQPVMGEHLIHLQGDCRKQTTKRTATLEVKYSEVRLEKPDKKSKDDRPDKVKVWIVEAKEPGKTDGIVWRLLTTHPVNSCQDALQIIEWYRMRWFIEEVFRLLKSKGYRIEDSQLESGWAIRKLTVLILQTILRVMQMLMAYGKEEQEDKVVFTRDEITCLEKVNIREEGKTEKLKNKYKQRTLQWATWIIARPGGWSGYESQRKPGPITLKNGLDVFNQIYLGWLPAKDVGTQ
jgi:hypothetical protein